VTQADLKLVTLLPPEVYSTPGPSSLLFFSSVVGIVPRALRLLGKTYILSCASSLYILSLMHGVSQERMRQQWRLCSDRKSLDWMLEVLSPNPWLHHCSSFCVNLGKLLNCLVP
jgi:hypothetical protein